MTILDDYLDKLDDCLSENNFDEYSKIAYKINIHELENDFFVELFSDGSLKEINIWLQIFKEKDFKIQISFLVHLPFERKKLFSDELKNVSFETIYGAIEFLIDNFNEQSEARLREILLDKRTSIDDIEYVKSYDSNINLDYLDL